MADPFAVATGAVAIVGFALQSAQQLSTLIDGVAEAPAQEQLVCQLAFSTIITEH